MRSGHLIILAALLAIPPSPAPAEAQAAPCLSPILVQTDSLRAETMRRSSAGAVLAPRGTVVRRLATRIDSLNLGGCGPVLTSIELKADYLTSGRWASGAVGRFPAPGASVIVCATVMVGGVEHIGDNAIEVTRAREDSAVWVVRPERDGTGLRDLCKSVYGREVGGVPTYRVRWTGDWLGAPSGAPVGARMFLPVPQPVVP